MVRLKFATVWLGGCSGCHMSFLDIDERLIELAGKVDLHEGGVFEGKEVQAATEAADGGRDCGALGQTSGG